MKFENIVFQPGDKLSADFLNYLQSVVGILSTTGSQLVVTLDEASMTVSHSASEIIAYLNSGGSVILKYSSTSKTSGFAHLYGVFYGSVYFFEVAGLSDNTEIHLYAVSDDKSCSFETIEMGNAGGGTVTQIDFSNFENGSFTETVNGEVVTHTVTFDAQNRPITIDGCAIVWGAT